MEDNSFLYFTQDEVIEKMNIDPRLVDSFKRVMEKMQAYYNANGYTSQRNFKEYIEKNFINSGENNMRIYAAKDEKPNRGGFYFRFKNEICINEKQLDASPATLDSTLCHEFTHFLVMHELDKEHSDPQIYNGGFINEALTEMFTQEIYPNSNAYDAQVSMHKFANLLSGNVNNFSRFLKGDIDARYSSHDWLHYESATAKFQKEFSEAGYISLAEAQQNENLIEAQRSLIDLFIRPGSKKNYEGYCYAIEKLLDRPVEDKEYIDNVIFKMDQELIRDLKIKDPNITKLYEEKLVELRRKIIESKQAIKNKVYEFEVGGKVFCLNKNLNLFAKEGSLVGIKETRNPRIGKMVVTYNNESIEINTNTIDFELKEKEIQKRINEISSYFSKNAINDLAIMSNALGQSGNLLKLERFTLPDPYLKSKRSSHEIYVATYEDKIVVLNDNEVIDEISNFDLYQYIGLTSSNPNVAMTVNEPLGKIDKGKVFSASSQKSILFEAKKLYSKDLETTMDPLELQELIEEYKASELYDKDDTEEIIKSLVVYEKAKELFDKLSKEEQKKYIDMAKKESDKFAISMKDGKLNVGVIKSEHKSMFVGNREVLFDVNGKGLYNDAALELKKNATKSHGTTQIKLDSKGNIVYQEEVKNMESLNNVIIELKELRKQYGIVAEQMEDLMIKNAKTSISDYQEQLDRLIKIRDGINEQIEKALKFQEKLANQEEEHHQKYISKAEKLLNTKITMVGHYEDGPIINGSPVPKAVYKDMDTLNNEFNNYNVQINRLFQEGKIDLNTYHGIGKALVQEKEKMIMEIRKSEKRKAKKSDNQEKYEEPLKFSDDKEKHVDSPLKRFENNEISFEEFVQLARIQLADDPIMKKAFEQMISDQEKSEVSNVEPSEIRRRGIR